MTLGPMPPIVKYHYQLGDMVVYGRQVYCVTNTIGDSITISDNISREKVVSENKLSLL